MNGQTIPEAIRQAVTRSLATLNLSKEEAAHLEKLRALIAARRSH